MNTLYEAAGLLALVLLQECFTPIAIPTIFIGLALWLHQPLRHMLLTPRLTMFTLEHNMQIS